MRYIVPYIKKDLACKMVFVGGPRQVGKTTLSQKISKEYSSVKYFNWDDDVERREILNRKWTEEDKLIIFDEIHKFPRWKNWLKGIYDTQKEEHTFLVTGSARLDVYRKGGDSMFGRYHYWRLHPFSLEEIPQNIAPKEALKRLMKVGGFPEPFLKNDEEFARRWRNERFNKIIREDIRDLEKVREIGNIQILTDLLRSRVGSPVVISHLAQDLQVTSETVKHWIEILENMYLCFSIGAYSKKLTRAISKPKRIFFFDNMDVVGDEGARFENFVASHLLKRLHFLEDKTGYRYELKYIRDKEGREIDFVIVKERQIEELIEVKLTDDKISRSLKYYTKKLNPPKSTQIVMNLRNSYDKDGIEVRSPLEYFSRQLVDFFE